MFTVPRVVAVSPQMRLVEVRKVVKSVRFSVLYCKIWITL